jgi:hypothetical protein
VYSGLFRAYPPERNGGCHVEVTPLMSLSRRDTKKVAKIAAVLASLSR